MKSKWRWLQLITVEPLMFADAFSRGLASPTQSALWYSKVCLNHFDEDTCQFNTGQNYTCDENSLSQNETFVQQETSKWMFYGNLCYLIPSLFGSLMYGSWGDMFTRKLPIIIPLSFAISGHVFDMINGIYLDGPLWFMLMGSLLYGIGGGYLCMLASSFSYLSEVVVNANRSTRIAMAYSMSYAGYFIASFISGFFLGSTSFAAVFLVCIIIYALGILYTLILLEDFRHGTKTTNKRSNDVNVCAQSTETSHDQSQSSDVSRGNEQSNMSSCDTKYEKAISKQNAPQSDLKSSNENEPSIGSTNHTKSENDIPKEKERTDGSTGPKLESDLSNDIRVCDLEPENESNRTCGKPRRAFNFRHVWEAIKMLFKPRQWHHRAHLLLLMLALVFMLTSSAFSIQYLYLKLPPRCFTQEMYGVYTGYKYAVNGISLLVIIPILTKKLKFKDTSVMILGSLSTMAGCVLLAFASEVWIVFIVPLVQIFGNGTLACLRGYSSTLLEITEQGKLFAVIACVEAVGEIIAVSIYNYLVYPDTVDYFAGFSFILEAIIYTIPLTIFIIIQVDLTRFFKKYGSLNEEIVEERTVDIIQTTVLDGEEFPVDVVRNGIKKGDSISTLQSYDNRSISWDDDTVDLVPRKLDGSMQNIFVPDVKKVPVETTGSNEKVTDC